MTSEQIAEWRCIDGRLRKHRDRILTATRELIPPARDVLGMALHENGLQRLLDEREALLEALTGLENWITRYVSANYITSDPPRPIAALATARRVLDKACSP